MRIPGPLVIATLLFAIACSKPASRSVHPGPGADHAPTLAVSTLLGAPLPIHRRPITGLAVDPAGSYAVTVTMPVDEYERELGIEEEPGVHVWDLATAKRLRTIGDVASRVLAATPDARIVAVVDREGTAVVYEVATGQVRAQVAVGPKVRWLGLDQGGEHLHVVDGNGKASRWEVATGKQTHELETQLEPRAVAGTPGGTVAIAGQGGALLLADLTTSDAPRTLEGHTGTVLGLDFSSDGTRLAALEDGGGVLWDLGAGAQIARIPGSGDTVKLLRDGARVAISTGTQGYQLRVVPVGGGRGSQLLDGWSGRSFALAELPGNRLLAGTFDGALRTFDLATGQDVRAATGHVGSIQVLAYEPDGTLFASAGVFSPDRGLRWASGAGNPSPAGTLIAGVPSGAVVATVRWTDDQPDAGTPVIVDILRGAHTTATEPIPYRPDLYALSADGQLLVTVTRGMAGDGDESEVATYDAASGKRISGFTTKDFVQALAVSPDGARIALGGRRVVLHDRSTGAPTTTLIADSFNIAELVFVNPTTLLVASESDGVQVWDAQAGTLRHQLYPGERGKPQGSGNTAYAAAVSPDGRFAASGHRHGEIVLWDLASGQRLGAAADGHTGLVTAAAFSPDGSRLATGDQHGQIRVWTLR